MLTPWQTAKLAIGVVGVLYGILQVNALKRFKGQRARRAQQVMKFVYFALVLQTLSNLFFEFGGGARVTFVLLGLTCVDASVILGAMFLEQRREGRLSQQQ